MTIVKKSTQELTWDVCIEELTNGLKFEKAPRVIIRNDNNTILSTVSADYAPFTNAQLMQLCNLAAENGPFETAGYSEFRNGKIVMGFLKNISRQSQILGYACDEYLVIGNSHDRSKKLFIGYTQQLVRCENQFSSISPFMKVRHYGNMINMNDLLKGVFDCFREGRLKIHQKIESLATKTINQEIVEQLVIHLLKKEQILNTKDKKKEVLSSKSAVKMLAAINKETNELGQNAFGLFNGVTWYTSHKMNARNRSFGNVHGAAHKMNSRALDFCLALHDAHK
jgi:hypothetical protein